MAKRGDLNHLKGFIVNKLYCHGCWVGRGGNQIKHHTETNLRSGYDRGQLRLWGKAMRQLFSEGVINISPHIGGEPHVAAYHTREAVGRGLVYRNIFAKTEGLPIWRLEDLI